MICVVCCSDNWMPSHFYSEPDMYEKWVGLTEVNRSWNSCEKCGMLQQDRNYPLSVVERIYEHGYRDVKFRGESIDEAFRRIMSIPGSENDARVEWLTDTIGIPKTMLDIGSGIGVFPYRMHELGVTVMCTEENADSLWFINSLGMRCVRGIPDYAKFELVSIVHVLEHIESPVQFLKDLRRVMTSNGRLFIEVPDAEAFSWLSEDHDDFNSCHVCAYDVSTLYRVLMKAGYDVTDIHRQYYRERKLSRIMAICRQKNGKES